MVQGVRIRQYPPEQGLGEQAPHGSYPATAPPGGGHLDLLVLHCNCPPKGHLYQHHRSHSTLELPEPSGPECMDFSETEETSSPVQAGKRKRTDSRIDSPRPRRDSIDAAVRQMTENAQVLHQMAKTTTAPLKMKLAIAALVRAVNELQHANKISPPPVTTAAIVATSRKEATTQTMAPFSRGSSNSILSQATEGTQTRWERVNSSPPPVAKPQGAPEPEQSSKPAKVSKIIRNDGAVAKIPYVTSPVSDVTHAAVAVAMCLTTVEEMVWEVVGKNRKVPATPKPFPSARTKAGANPRKEETGRPA
ncbi:hypothetical protein WN55_09814 [Dufourea novaeangliae]|uniref:Uncharacterized protein n=1 Tax=Dufourea novaeangliae TaxID=178035 RepID=A0A154P987_DUFNO|nr:hypothetical protein WN55_09814 [Dufourea novaeangliae]